MSSRGYFALVLTAASVAMAGCGDDDDKRYSDARIVDKLNLEEVQGQKDYAIDGDLFCSVERKLLNTRSEVEEADENTDLVVASREGNVGVIGVPVFATDCAEKARKKLNRLDPEPAD
ncbi:MAG TPA: hypothetical protein VHF58_03015 [Solirubrobacterales bacterium]|nr:hypothetical protein [Solirubrobacterales bacterium]